MLVESTGRQKVTQDLFTFGCKLSHDTLVVGPAFCVRFRFFIFIVLAVFFSFLLLVSFLSFLLFFLPSFLLFGMCFDFFAAYIL